MSDETKYTEDVAASLAYPSKDKYGQPIYTKTDGITDAATATTTTGLSSGVPYLGEAMQAIHELPLALFKYKSTDDVSNKETFGVIIERLRETQNFIKAATQGFGHTFNFVESDSNGNGKADSTDDNTVSTFVSNRKTYMYDYTERQSIINYINTMVQASEDHQDVLSTVGILLKAAQETQDRLLGLEVSTFGYDSPTIPGNVKTFNNKVDTPLVNQEPLDYGLNRSVSLIMRDLYGSTTIDAWSKSIKSGGDSAIDALSYILDAVGFYETKDYSLMYQTSDDADHVYEDNGRSNVMKNLIYDWASTFPKIFDSTSDVLADVSTIGTDKMSATDMAAFVHNVQVRQYKTNTSSTTITLGLFDPDVCFMTAIRKICTDLYGQDTPFASITLKDLIYYLMTKAFYMNSTFSEDNLNPEGLTFLGLKKLIADNTTSFYDIAKSIAFGGFKDPWIKSTVTSPTVIDALTANKATYSKALIDDSTSEYKWTLNSGTASKTIKELFGGLVSDYTAMRNVIGFDTMYHFGDADSINTSIEKEDTAKYLAYKYLNSSGAISDGEMTNLNAKGTALREYDSLVNRMRKVEQGLDNINAMSLDTSSRFEQVALPYDTFNIGYFYGEAFHGLMSNETLYKSFYTNNSSSTAFTPYTMEGFFKEISKKPIFSFYKRFVGADFTNYDTYLSTNFTGAVYDRVKEYATSNEITGTFIYTNSANEYLIFVETTQDVGEIAYYSDQKVYLIISTGSAFAPLPTIIPEKTVEYSTATSGVYADIEKMTPLVTSELNAKIKAATDGSASTSLKTELSSLSGSSSGVYIPTETNANTMNTGTAVQIETLPRAQFYKYTVNGNTRYALAGSGSSGYVINDSAGLILTKLDAAYKIAVYHSYGPTGGDIYLPVVVPLSQVQYGEINFVTNITSGVQNADGTMTITTTKHTFSYQFIDGELYSFTEFFTD